MSDAVIVAVITGICTIVGVVLTNISSNRKVEQTLETSQAVTDTKIDELTREVREHNQFARRMPVVEEQIKNINSRLETLERKVD